MAKPFATIAILAALLLAGCSDNGDGGSPSTSSSSGTGTGGTGGNGTLNNPPEPIVLTGTVSGAEDCSLEAQGRDAVSAASVTLPAEASNRSYALTFSGGQSSPVGFTGCIGFAGGPITGGASGTIPAGATAAQIAINLGQGRTYTLTIT